MTRFKEDTSDNDSDLTKSRHSTNTMADESLNKEKAISIDEAPPLRNGRSSRLASSNISTQSDRSRRLFRHSEISGGSTRSIFRDSYLSTGNASGRFTMPAKIPRNVVGSDSMKKENRMKFGKNICSSKIDWDEIRDFSPPTYEKSAKTVEFLESTLNDMFLFSDFTDSDTRCFIDAMSAMEVEKGHVIISQGDDGDYFYVLEEGEVCFLLGDKEVSTGTRGKTFGELALIYNCPRTASCIATRQCKLWKIDQKTFRFLLVHSTHKYDDSVIKVLKKVSLFEGFDDEFFEKLSKALELKQFEDEEVVIRKGDVGDTFYVIQEGVVAIREVGQVNRKSLDKISLTLGAGDFFGERALLTGDVRSATVIAFGAVSLLCLKREDFERILGPLEHLLEQSRWRHILMSVPQFSEGALTKKEQEALASLDSKTLEELTKAMYVVRFKSDEIVVRKGDVGDTFYIIKSGAVSVSHLSDTSMTFDVADKTLGPNEFFGERSLFTGDVRSATVTAREDTELLCLDRDDAERILDTLQSVLDRARWRRVLLDIPQVKKANFGSKELDDLIALVQKQRFNKGQIVSDVGRMQKRAIYLLNAGRISVTYGKRNEIRRTGDYFGESFLKEDKQYDENGVLTFLEDSVCGVLPALQLRSKLRRIVHNRSKFKSLTLESFNVFKLLGEGSFGQVYLVNRDNDEVPCALKVMSKAEIHKKNQTLFILGEKSVMSELNHPFILNMITAFQNDFSLFLLLHLCEGGELYQLMQNSPQHKLPFRSTQLYCACIVEAFCYMHEKKIIHRDIKAENIMLDHHGFPILIDFGFAKRVESKTYTVCGTPFYMAPETILSKGYDKSVDIWALGVVYYEMCVGYEPFYAEDEMSLYREICELRYHVPSPLDGFSDVSRRFVKEIFTKVNKRLGCLVEGSKGLKSHELFSDINWESLRSRKVDMPWKPTQDKLVNLNEMTSAKSLSRPRRDGERLGDEANRSFGSFGFYVNNPLQHEVFDPSPSNFEPVSKSCCVLS